MKKSTFIDLAVIMAVRSKPRKSEPATVEELITTAMAGNKQSALIFRKKISEITLAVLADELRA